MVLAVGGLYSILFRSRHNISMSTIAQIRALLIFQWSYWTSRPWQIIAVNTLLGFLAFSVLWKGGKSLESTWLLVAVAWLCVLTEWQGERRAGSGERLTVPLLLWVSVIAFILWTFISFLYSTTLNYGLDEILRTSALGLLFLWVVRCSGSDFVQRVFRVITTVTLIACVIGAIIYVFQPVDRFVGTFFDSRFHTDYWPNAWGQYLLLAWPIVWWWIHKQKEIRLLQHEGMRLPVFGFVVGCLFLSYSRGAFIVFVGQIILWVLLMRPWTMLHMYTVHQKVKMVIQPLLIIVIAFGIFFLVNGMRGQLFSVQSVTEKVTFTAQEGTSSIDERRQFWGQAFALAWEKPFLGWGPYSFRFVQPRLQDGVLATSDHPHNLFAKIAMERGFPATFVLMGILIAVVYMSGRRLWLYQKHRLQYDLPIFLSVVGVLGHNMIDYNLQFVGIALPFWILLGLLASSVFSQERPPRLHRCYGLAEVLLVSFLLIIAVLEARHLITSSFGRHAEARGDIMTALQWYDRADTQLFSRDLYLSRTNLLIKVNRFKDAKTSIDEYMKINREDARAWRLTGDLLLAQAQYTEALSAYERAFLYAKENDLGILRGIIETIMAKGDIDLLRERLPQIEFWMERFASAIEQNAHFSALSHNVEEYIKITELLGTVFSSDLPHYQVMAARVDRNAREERERIISRGTGWLW
jgi:O-antigen ligase